MKSKTRLLLLATSFGIIGILPSCESTGPSNTHEMGGPGKPRMDNSLMPNRGPVGSDSGSGSNTHEMGGPGKPRMDNSLMPGRN